MRRLINIFLAYFESHLRRVSDGITARLMLLGAYRGVESKPLAYRGWAVNLVMTPEGCFVLVAGRRVGAKLEDIAALLGTLVRVSDSADSALPPFQVVSRTGRFVAWGWRPDGFELSDVEQAMILSVVLGHRERSESWKELN